MLYYFDVLQYPVSLTLAPCRGSPVFRAGITDYYMRSNFSTPGFNYTAERVWMPNTTTNEEQNEIVFNIMSGTMYAIKGDWIMEVGDWRKVAMNMWSADFYAGNADPRPGVPIRTFDFGYNSGTYQARFSLGIPLGKGLGVSDLEYSLWILPKFANQSIYYNPKQACGFR